MLAFERSQFVQRAVDRYSFCPELDVSSAGPPIFVKCSKTEQ